MARIAAGIDAGTHRIRIVVGERVVRDGAVTVRTLSAATAPSRGLRHGYIIDHTEAAQSIRDALRTVTRDLRSPLESAYVSIGGVSLEGVAATGTVIISRPDGLITNLDVEQAILETEKTLDVPTSNIKLLHTIPLEFKIDGKEVLGKPAGMKGLKVEAKALLITCLEQHASGLVAAVEEAGVEVEEIIASPIAAAVANLTKTERIAGVVLANIGSETVSIVVYENNKPTSLKVFPIGSTDITNDIALGLRIPLEEAEALKIKGGEEGNHPKKKLQDIVSARLSDIFELIDRHLKKIKRDGLLPAGVVITGGGSSIARVEELAKQALRLPSSIAHLEVRDTHTPLNDPAWSVAYGLCLIGLAGPPRESRRLRPLDRFRSALARMTKQVLP